MHKIVILIMLVSFIFLSFTGCAALFNSGGGRVSFMSNPSSAEVIIDGQSLGRTPVTLQLDRRQTHTVTIKKNGRVKNYILNTEISAGWIILDVLAGFVPIVVDAVTGSWYSLTPKSVNAQL